MELNKAIGLDIINDNLIVGFDMLSKNDDGCYFLWDYAIDCKYQNKQYGTKALMELIEYFNNNFSLKDISTTYMVWNSIAAHVYAKIGFETTDITDDDIPKINMLLTIKWFIYLPPIC